MNNPNPSVYRLTVFLFRKHILDRYLRRTVCRTADVYSFLFLDENVAYLDSYLGRTNTSTSNVQNCIRFSEYVTFLDEYIRRSNSRTCHVYLCLLMRRKIYMSKNIQHAPDCCGPKTYQTKSFSPYAEDRT